MTLRQMEATTMKMTVVIVNEGVDQQTIRTIRTVTTMMTQVLMTNQLKPRKKATQSSKPLDETRKERWENPSKNLSEPIQSLRATQRMDDDEKVAYLRSAMTGLEAQMLWRIEGFSYKQLIKKFEHQFCSDKIQEKFQNELRCCCRGKHESYPELSQNVQWLMNLAYPEDNDSTTAKHVARDAFLTAIKDSDLEFKVLEREPKNLDTAMEIAQLLEAIKL